MLKADFPAVERIIANTIKETARGDPDALAARVFAALDEAGYHIVPADTAPGSQPDKYGMEQLYRSPNGDTWFLAATSRPAWHSSGIRRTRRQAVR